MRRGFTLLELTITMTAALAVFGLLLGFYISYFRIWQYELQKQNLNRQFCAFSEKIAVSQSKTGRLDISGAPFKDIQVKQEKNNLYKITVSAPLGRQVYVYEHYFRGAL